MDSVKWEEKDVWRKGQNLKTLKYTYSHTEKQTGHNNEERERERRK